jgi:hypothetical protein
MHADASACVAGSLHNSTRQLASASSPSRKTKKQQHLNCTRSCSLRKDVTADMQSGNTISTRLIEEKRDLLRHTLTEYAIVNLIFSSDNITNNRIRMYAMLISEKLMRHTRTEYAVTHMFA